MLTSDLVTLQKLSWWKWKSAPPLSRIREGDLAGPERELPVEGYDQLYS
jgi:hypothetical protein